MFPTKRKQEDSSHPYNTRSRSRSYHVMTHPTTSLRNDTYTPSSSAGGRAEEGQRVPPTLYNSIQLALAARKVYEAKRTKLSESEMHFVENLVSNIAYGYKSKKLLPVGWMYNPDTASTLKPKNDTLLLWLNGKPIYPSMEHLKVIDVPLREEEIEIWLQFKLLDECTPRSCFKRYPLSTEHPIVSSVGWFAVDGFNEAFEFFVEKGNYNRLRDPTFRECTYFITGGYYSFNVTIVADEDGFIGIYKVIVECTLDGKKRSLKKFMLADVKYGKKKRESKSIIPKDVCLPDIYYTGMCCRSTINGIMYGCYDYFDPSEICE